MSTNVMFFRPTANKILVVATPAAPIPLTTTFNCCKFFPTTFAALIRPARTTIAVPV